MSVAGEGVGAGVRSVDAVSVLDLELGGPIPSFAARLSAERLAGPAWLIVRLFGEPLGIERLGAGALGDVAEVVAALRANWQEAAAARGIALTGEPETSLAAGRTSFATDHAQYLEVASPAAVVICTHERPDDLRRCLQSLVEQDHPRFTVWVIDNAPRSDATRAVARAFEGRLQLRYVVEPRPGLSRARNAALAQDLETLVAWIDDDEEADRLWLSELMRALEADPAADGASGVVVPGELETRPQVWFEQFGGHSKARGFRPDRFSPATRSLQSPLYPLPPFGVGANMGFRTGALRRIGGFDVALGAGTRTRGGEDTLAFSEILRRGGTTLYCPTAMTRHYHRRDLAGLTAQMRGYGTGLTAFYTALVLRHPQVLPELVRLTRTAARDMSSDSSLRVATLEPDFPTELLRANRRGMASGPIAYMRELLAAAF